MKRKRKAEPLVIATCVRCGKNRRIVWQGKCAECAEK